MDRSRLVPVLEQMVYTIYVLTAAAGEKRHAMVVSWVTQVSWDPLRVAVGIRRGRYAHTLIPDGGNFALHLMDPESAHELARIKAAVGEGSLEGVSITLGRSGAPILTGCAGFLDCTLHRIVDAGDHSLFIGDVVDGALLKSVQVLSTREYGKGYLGRR